MPRKLDIIRKWFNTDSHEEAFNKTHGNDVDVNEPPIEECIKSPWPYYAPADSLPAPLPTIEDIENVRNTENDLTKHKFGLGDGYVYRVNDVFAVKFSVTMTMMREMENMLFLEQNSKVRIPKLYAAYTQRGDPVGWTSDNPPRRATYKRTRDELPPYHFLVMEYIEGYTLYDKWQELEINEKKKICTKIGEQLRLLRSIPSPGYYGRVYHQPFFETASILTTQFQEPLGPYDTYNDLANAMADAAEFKLATGHTREEFSPREQLGIDHLRAAYANCEHNEPKFTHIDLQLHNIMLKPIVSNKEGGQQEYEVVLIDWTRAAWYPAWAEAVCVLEDWAVDKKLQPYLHMDIFAYHVAQGFEPFPHKDAVYFRQVFRDLNIFF